MENKPREWKIPLVTLVVNNNPPEPRSEVIHVIEYSAYEYAQTDIALLKIDKEYWYEKFSDLEMNRASCCVYHEGHNIELKAEIARLREALDSISIKAGDVKSIFVSMNYQEELQEMQQLNQIIERARAALAKEGK